MSTDNSCCGNVLFGLAAVTQYNNQDCIWPQQFLSKGHEEGEEC